MSQSIGMKTCYSTQKSALKSSPKESNEQAEKSWCKRLYTMTATNHDGPKRSPRRPHGGL